MNAIPQSEIEMAVFEAAFAEALENIVGVPVAEAELSTTRGWPAQEVVWVALPLERPFTGRCWAVAPAQLARHLVLHTWRGLVTDDSAMPFLFADLVADLLNASIGRVRHDASSCMYADHFGFGRAPQPTGERTSVVWRVGGQLLLLCIEREPGAVAATGHDFPAWAELAIPA